MTFHSNIELVAMLAERASSGRVMVRVDFLERRELTELMANFSDIGIVEQDSVFALKESEWIVFVQGREFL